MGCSDGFSNTNIIIKVAFFVIFISTFANWLAFTTNSWTRTDYADDNYFNGEGLWRQGTGVRVVAGVVIQSGASQTDGIGNTKMGVVQAFGIIGFMAQNIGFLLLNLFMFKHNYQGNREIRLASAVLLIISAVGWLISVAIYGAMAADANAEDNLHYSYALAVVACGLGLIGGILVLLGGRGDGSVGAK